MKYSEWFIKVKGVAVSQWINGSLWKIIFVLSRKALGKSIKIKYSFLCETIWRDKLNNLPTACVHVNKKFTMNKKILLSILCFVMLSVAVNAAIPQEKLAKKANSQGTTLCVSLEKKCWRKQIFLWCFFHSCVLLLNGKSSYNFHANRPS